MTAMHGGRRRALLVTALAICSAAGCDKPDSAPAASETTTSSASASAPAPPSSVPSAAPSVTTPKDPRLFPLELEREWTYEVESSYPKCKGMVIRVLSKRESDGAFEVQLPCVTTFIRTKGNTVETQVRGGPVWERMLDDKVQAGHSWKTSNSSATYEYEYTPEKVVQTPAGEFTDCWRVTQKVRYESFNIYCPGVGLVRQTLKDLFGGGLSLELVAKNF